MEHNWPREDKGYDKPMLSEGDRLAFMMQRLSIFPSVQTSPRGGVERAGQRLRQLYDEVASLPIAGSTQRISYRPHRSISRSKEIVTGLVSVSLANRPQQPDIMYRYQPDEDGSINYSALINPYDDNKVMRKTAEEVGLYQAEMALDLVLQVRQVGDFKAKLYPANQLGK